MANDPPASAETGLFTRHPWLPYALLVCAMAFYSMGFVVGRAIRDEVPPVGLVFWRAGLACALLLPLIHRQLAAQLPLLLRHWRLFLGLALTQSVLGQGLLFVSLHTTTAINVGLLQTLQPVFILFLVALLFGERIGLRQGVGTAVALLGVLVTVARGDLDVLLGLGFVPGDILILIGTASWSVYTILVKRAPALNPLVLFFGITAVGGALLLPLYLAETLLLGRTMPLSWSAVGAVGYVATINGIAALTLVNIGIIHLGPSRAGVFYYLIPVFGAVLAVLLLDESFRAFHAVGMGLVLLGVYLAGRTAPP